MAVLRLCRMLLYIFNKVCILLDEALQALVVGCKTIYMEI